MTSTYGPATAMQRALVELLRADVGLQALLFPVVWPSRSSDDFRVWGMNSDLPEGMLLRDPLPVVLIEAMSYPADREQVSEVLEGEVIVTTHSQAPRQYEALAAQVDAYVAQLIVSTQLSDARMIAAALVPDGQTRKERIGAFDDAFDFQSRYRSPNVGVLQ